MTACQNPDHDHTTPVDSEGHSLPTPVPMLCNHDGVPTHYDEAVSDYVHDEGDGCFLALAANEGSPCEVRIA